MGPADQREKKGGREDLIILFESIMKDAYQLLDEFVTKSAIPSAFRNHPSININIHNILPS